MIAAKLTAIIAMSMRLPLIACLIIAGSHALAISTVSGQSTLTSESKEARQQFDQPSLPLEKIGVERWQYDFWYQIIVGRTGGASGRKPSERVKRRFRFDRVEHLTELARQVMRWVLDNGERVAASDPKIPDSIKRYPKACFMLQIPVHRGQSFRRIADSVPVIADSFR